MVLIIVARDEQGLLDELRRGLAEVADVHVIRDRRLWRRRERVGPRTPERRQQDRRRRPVTLAQLSARGFVIVRPVVRPSPPPATRQPTSEAKPPAPPAPERQKPVGRRADRPPSS